MVGDPGEAGGLVALLGELAGRSDENDRELFEMVADICYELNRLQRRVEQVEGDLAELLARPSPAASPAGPRWVAEPGTDRVIALHHLVTGGSARGGDE